MSCIILLFNLISHWTLSSIDSFKKLVTNGNSVRIFSHSATMRLLFIYSERRRAHRTVALFSVKLLNFKLHEFIRMVILIIVDACADASDMNEQHPSDCPRLFLYINVNCT